MPLFSAFTSFGILEFNANPSVVEDVYDAYVNTLGNQYDLTVGGYTESKVYAKAHALGAARMELRRAGNQAFPLKCLDLLENQEASYGLIPGQGATILERQQALAAKMLVPNGASLTNVSNFLAALLGSEFISLYVLPNANATVSEPTSVFAPPAQAFKIVQFLDPVADTGTQILVQYGSVDPTIAAPALIAGDVLTVQPENSGLIEVVTVAATVGSNVIAAVFANPHDPGCVATTQNWCQWISSQRTWYVVVTDDASIDPETRRIVSELMAIAVPGVSQWEIVQESAANTLGPFTLNVSPVGVTPIGSITI